MGFAQILYIPAGNGAASSMINTYSALLLDLLALADAGVLVKQLHLVRPCLEIVPFSTEFAIQRLSTPAATPA